MAKKKAGVKAGGKPAAPEATEAKFPYTTKPASLRRLLKSIPAKPKPGKFDVALLKSWDFRDQNDHSMLRVLKAIHFLNDKNEPTDQYARFMSLDGGAAVLGIELRQLYAPLFTASHTPYSEPSEKLQNLFNIHSGGGDRALDLQIQTFKTLCENASFASTTASAAALAVSETNGALGLPGNAGASSAPGQPAININLHIHLPENKTRREYEDIIEDIGRYIFGRTVNARRE
jgi:hypothetical protein